MSRNIQGDYIWVEPSTGLEFDVAIGARVTSIDNKKIAVQDDVGKVTSYASATYCSPERCWQGNILCLGNIL